MSLAAQMRDDERRNSTALDPAAFRQVCGTFATGVTVVTTSGPDGPYGATVNAFTSLSVDPPQVLVCLAQTSRTWAAVQEAGRFAVNILAADQEDVARLLATSAPDKMDRVAWTPGTNGSPVLDGVVGALECDLSAALAQATHMVLIGRVSHAVHVPVGDPLIFFRSAMHAGPATGTAC